MLLESIQELFVEELLDLYHAENQLPKTAKAASVPELKATFEDHLEVTRNQIEHFNEIFREIDMSPQRKCARALQGLLEKGKELTTKRANRP